MRDHVFIREFERLTPKLEIFFSRAMRIFQGDLAVEVDDLIQETGKGALMNSRLPQYEGYSCERLIFEKAYRVLHSYYHPPLKKVPALLLKVVKNKASSQDVYTDVVNRQWLESIYQWVDPITWIICYLDYAGYKYAEIADHLGLTIPAVKMRIHRLRQKLS